MAIEVCVLASGSAGNCTVVRTPGGVLLIDAGLGPRTAAQRLAGTGAAPGDVVAICLTHLDRDHFNPNWTATILRRGIRVFCCARRMPELLRCALGADPHPDDVRSFTALVCPFTDDAFEPIPGLSARPIPLAHDRLGSHGFVLHGFGCRVGYATDLGRVPQALVECFEGLDVLALESNYDSRMQQQSPRPGFLKQRITGGRGHLSNEQAFDAVKQILNRSESRGARLPAHIVLLHRSRQCNCPDLLRKLFSRDARIAQRLTLAEQYERSGWLGANERGRFVGEQLSLAWG